MVVLPNACSSKLDSYTRCHPNNINLFVEYPSLRGSGLQEHLALPELGYDLIPKERYISDEYLEKEWHSMWSKVWLLGAMESDIAEPGDYVCVEIGRESVILVRRHAAKLKLFTTSVHTVEIAWWMRA